MKALSKELYKALMAGDRKAPEKIYREYYDPVYFLALQILKNPHDAEDAVQQTFLNAFKGIGSLRDYQSFPVWLSSIARRESFRILRNRKKNETLEEVYANEMYQVVPDELQLPQVYAERRELIERLREIIDSLPTPQREALVLQLYHQMSLEQIAEVTDSNINTVKSRLFYARRTIKAEIEKYESEGKDFSGVVLIPFGTAYLRTLENEEPSRKTVNAGWKALNRQLETADDSIDSQISGLLPTSEKNGFGMAAKITAGLLVATAIVTSVSSAVSNTPGGRFGNTAGSQDGEDVPVMPETTAVTDVGTEPTEDRAQPLPQAEIAPAAYEAAQAIAQDAPYDVPAQNLADENDDTTDEQITPPATQTPTTAPATEAATESPLSPVYNAYRELLDNEHFALEEFGDFNGNVKQVALADVYGGNTPELLFLTGSPGDSSCQLVIATYDNGGTTVLNRTYNLPLGSGFCLFLKAGTLYSCIADTNGGRTAEVSYYRYDDSSALPYHYNILQDTLLMHQNDNDGYHYSLSDAGEVTGAEYNTAQSELLDKVDAVVFTLGSEKLPEALRTATDRAAQLGMTTAEAEKLLGAE